MNEYNRLHFSYAYEPGYNLLHDNYRCREWASPQHPDYGIKIQFKINDVIMQ